MGRPKTKAKWSIIQATEIQQLGHKLLGDLYLTYQRCEDERVKASLGAAFASNVKAWCNLIDTKRELLGKPRAGTLQPEMRAAGRGKSRTILLPALRTLTPSPPIDCQTAKDVDTIEPSVQRPL
jgi:hypothetical protein